MSKEGTRLICATGLLAFMSTYTLNPVNPSLSTIMYAISYCCSPLMLRNSLYFGAHLLRHILPQIPIGTAAAMLNMTMTP